MTTNATPTMADAQAAFARTVASLRTETAVLQSYLDHGLPAGVTGVTTAINELTKVTIMLANLATGQLK